MAEIGWLALPYRIPTVWASIVPSSLSFSHAQMGVRLASVTGLLLAELHACIVFLFSAGWAISLSFALSSGRPSNHRDRNSVGRDESKNPSCGSSCQVYSLTHLLSVLFHKSGWLYVLKTVYCVVSQLQFDSLDYWMLSLSVGTPFKLSMYYHIWSDFPNRSPPLGLMRI